jgi:hypothetical protein
MFFGMPVDMLTDERFDLCAASAVLDNGRSDEGEASTSPMATHKRCEVRASPHAVHTAQRPQHVTAGAQEQQSPKASMLASETEVVQLILLTANDAPLETEVVDSRQQWVAK